VKAYGLEIDVSVPQAAIVPPMLEGWSPPVQQVLQHLAHQHQYSTARLQAQLIIGDARQSIQQLVAEGFQADAIFFDPFSPRHCPQLWTVEFFQQVAHCLAPTGRLATYSRAAAVRSALLQAGFCIGNIPLNQDQPRPHEWSQGTVGQIHPQAFPPLSQMEQEHLQTRAAIPYRDPDLQGSADAILERHCQEQQASTLESTSSWRRRWGIR
jgi:tRNA U34 5-methylaminomethyl-2-thiouridine-forming methyltransferase MnmC